MIDIHALSGAYAVDALDDIERAQFERHLASCDTCRDEVASLREAAALMPETSATQPPASLRDSVLGTIESVRPLPPVVVAATERARSTRRRFPALVAAAVALIALGAAGATVWHPWAEDPTTMSAAQRVEDAPDAQTFEHELADGSTITVVRSKSLNQAMISTDGLPRLSDAQTYELWLQHGKRMVRAGLIDGDAHNVLLEGDPARANAVGITIEPAGGSEEPTSDAIALIELA